MKEMIYNFDFSEEDKALFKEHRKMMDNIRDELVEEIRKEEYKQTLKILKLAIDPNWELKEEFNRFAEREKE